MAKTLIPLYFRETIATTLGSVFLGFISLTDNKAIWFKYANIQIENASSKIRHAFPGKYVPIFRPLVRCERNADIVYWNL